MIASSKYLIKVDDTSHSQEDPLVTGQQLLDLAGKRPSDQYLVYQVLKDGQLESIRPDETVDLQHAGVEKFLTTKSDRTFFFTLDGRKFEWPSSIITGRKLKDMAGVDPRTY
jgi:hypothetical protein